MIREIPHKCIESKLIPDLSLFLSLAGFIFHCPDLQGLGMSMYQAHMSVPRSNINYGCKKEEMPKYGP